MTERLQRRHVDHLMDSAEVNALTNPAAAAMLGWLAVTLSVVKERDAAEARLAEAESHIAALRGPLLWHFGTTDPELLSELWKDSP